MIVIKRKNILDDWGTVSYRRGGREFKSHQLHHFFLLNFNKTALTRMPLELIILTPYKVVVRFRNGAVQLSAEEITLVDKREV